MMYVTAVSCSAPSEAPDPVLPGTSPHSLQPAPVCCMSRL